MASLLTQKEFTIICGVSKQVLYKAIRAGHIKVKKSGKIRKVVFDDERTQAWYAKRIAGKQNNNIEPELKNEKFDGEKKGGLTELQREKIIQEIGKLKADRHLKELKYSKERGDLIEKETLAKILFQYLNALNINMLDVPDMIIDSLIDKVKAKASRGDLIKIMRDKIQKEIVNTKKSMQERLK